MGKRNGQRRAVRQRGHVEQWPGELVDGPRVGRSQRLPLRRKTHPRRDGHRAWKERRGAKLAGGGRDAEGMINTMMFEPVSGYYYDIAIDTKAPITIQGPEGWIPLWAGVADEAQAAAVRSVIVNPDKFATHVPFPTVGKDQLASRMATGGAGMARPSLLRSRRPQALWLRLRCAGAHHGLVEQSPGL